jgi:hypothetical protein
MDSPQAKPPTSPGGEIKSNLDAIVDIAEKWLLRLRRRRKQVKLASAILTAVLVFVAVAGATFAYIVTQYTLSFFYQHPKLIVIIFVSVAALAIVLGAGSFFFEGRKLDRSLDELEDLIVQMKRQRVAADAQAVSPDLLAVTEKILNLLPEVVRKRNQDSFLFGVLAFVLTAVPARPPLAILIGVLVWLYFRYEMNKDYDREIARFEEQKQLFERRKSEFLQTL